MIVPFLTAALPVVGNIAGGLFEHSQSGQAIKGLESLAGTASQRDPTAFTGTGGSLMFGPEGGSFVQNPQQALIQQAMLGNIGGGLTGGGLQSQLFQQANLGGSPEFTGAQGFLGTPFAPNLDVNNIINERLNLLRQQAEPFETRAENRFVNKLFGTGQRGTSGGGDQIMDFASGLGQADLARQLSAQDLGLRTQGQLFGQALQGQQQNMSQGQQRLANMLNLFGLRSGGVSQDLAASQGLFGQTLQQQDLERGLFLGSLGADTSRMNAQAAVLAAQSGLLGAQQGQAARTGGLISGAIGGISKGIGKIFSDRRLKTNVEFHKTVNGINFYTFDWTPAARTVSNDLQGSDVGVIAQELAESHPELVMVDDKSGYYMVNYDGVAEIING